MTALLYPEMVLQFLYSFQHIINKNASFHCKYYSTGFCLCFNPLWWHADLDTIPRNMKDKELWMELRKMGHVEYLLIRKKNGYFPSLQNQALKEVDIDQLDFRIWTLKGKFMDIFKDLKLYLTFQNFYDDSESLQTKVEWSF